MNEYRECWLCGRNGCGDPLDEHHIFEGTAGRRISEKLGLTVYLCHERCHIFGPKAAHNCRETAELLHRYGQKRAMLEQGWTVEEFRRIIGKNYLDEDEIAEIEEIRSGGNEDGGWFYETEEVLPEWLCA